MAERRGGVKAGAWANPTLAATSASRMGHPSWWLNEIEKHGCATRQTNYQGAIEQSCRSLPYGNGESCLPSPTEHLFTGKERDAESGLDYFGARYYGSSMGRFLSPDPSNLSVDVYLPQTWNRYSYTLNNPLNMVDRNGEWPAYIHNRIIDEAFPGMSKEDLQTLKDASWNMDYGPGQQNAANSIEHGMSDGLTHQTPEQARQWSDAFISKNEQKAAKIQAAWIASGHKGIAPAALSAFGNALHTVEDQLSPAHIGFQPWYGQSAWNPSAWMHFLHESSISGFQMNLAVSAATKAFADTFGPFGYRYDEFDVLDQQQPQLHEQVTFKICYQDSNGGIQCH